VINDVRSVDLKGHSRSGSGGLELATTPCTKQDCPVEGDVVDRKDHWMATHNGPNPAQTASLKQPQTLSLVKVFQVVVGLKVAHDVRSSLLNLRIPDGPSGLAIMTVTSCRCDSRDAAVLRIRQPFTSLVIEHDSLG
jgi:hypothetical protein